MPDGASFILSGTVLQVSAQYWGDKNEKGANWKKD